MIINRNQLKLQIDRLINVYGDNRFSEQRELMIWDEVEGLEYELVIDVVDKFIRENAQAPLPIDFRNAVKLYSRSKKRWALGEMRPQETSQCWDCGDSGFVRVIRNETFEPWARYERGSAPCHCVRGKMLIEAAAKTKPEPTHLGPQFNSSWEKSYSVIPTYGDGKWTP